MILETGLDYNVQHPPFILLSRRSREGFLGISRDGDDFRDLAGRSRGGSHKPGCGLSARSICASMFRPRWAEVVEVYSATVAVGIKEDRASADRTLRIWVDVTRSVAIDIEALEAFGGKLFGEVLPQLAFPRSRGMTATAVSTRTPATGAPWIMVVSRHSGIRLWCIFTIKRGYRVRSRCAIFGLGVKNSTVKPPLEPFVRCLWLDHRGNVSQRPCRSAFVPHVGHVEPLHHPVFLEPIAQREPFCPNGSLENVEAAVEDDLPSRVGDNIPCVRIA